MQHSQVMPLRYLMKHAEILKFEISVTNSDGSRRTDTPLEAVEEEEDEKPGKKKKKPQAKGPKSN